MQNKNYRKPFDPSKWTPSQDKDATAAAITGACKLISSCLWRESDLPKGINIFGMGIRLTKAFYDFFKDREGKPMPSQVEVQILWDIVGLNQNPGSKSRKLLPVAEINFKENIKILEDAFPGLYGSVSLEQAEPALTVKAKLEERDSEIEELKKQIALLQANQLQQQKAS